MAGGWNWIQATGVAGLPTSDVSAVQLSVTVFSPSLSGYLKLTEDDTEVPTSALVYTGGGGSVSASSIVALAGNGQFGVLSQRSVNLLITVQGYYTAGTAGPAPGGYVPVKPTRLVDTRYGTGLPQAKLATNTTTGIQVGGLAGVPATASAVYVMLTAITSGSAGYFTPYPTGTLRPANVSMNYLANTATIVGAAVDLGAGGQFNLWIGPSGAAIDVVVDLVGYYTAAAGTGGAFTPAAARVYDSRLGTDTPVPANTSRRVRVGGVAGVPLPSTGISAYAINAQLVHSGSSYGYLALAPGDNAAAAVSTVYYSSTSVLRGDLAIVPSASDGTVLLVNHSGDPLDVILDVQGWFAVHTPPAPLISSAQYQQDMTAAPPTGAGAFAVSADLDLQATVVRFEWALDGGSIGTVTPARDDDLLLARIAPSAALMNAPGLHTLRVTSVDQQGRRSPATAYSWTIGDPGADLGQPPDTPVVISPTYLEDVWSPIAQTAVFDVSAANQNPPVSALSYALDDATEVTIAASSAHLELPSPSTPGVHVLHVSATNAQGYSSYDYAFYLGVTPDRLSSVTVTPGQASALISWPAATIASGSVSGYDVQLVDASGAVADIGSCAACTSMAISGIGSTTAYTARLTPTSAAGPATSTSSTAFTGLAAGTVATCGTAGGCTSTDASCSIATCNTAGIDGQPVYSATYLAADGSSARAQAASAAYLVTRASDGTAGIAGDMVLSGSLGLSVTATDAAEAAGVTTPMPATITPRGYLLRGNNRVDDYHYRSENGLMRVTKTIRGTKYLIGAVKVQMRETLFGGDSHRWKIEVRASWADGDPFDFYYAYNCGVNVPKTEDWTCKTHESDADGTWDDDVVHGCYGNISEIYNASFGSTETRYAKFPLLAYRTGYRDGGYSVHDYLYYRGWDVRKTGTPWIMANVSGTGS